MNKVYISPGNRKLGDIPSVSLHPDHSCDKDVMCRGECYALRMARFRKNINNSWLKNSNIYVSEPERYFAEIADFIARYRTQWFRFHVGGDIPDIGYFLRMVELAEVFPSVKFLAFTKRYYMASIFKSELSDIDNMKIMLSAWRVEHPKSKFVEYIDKIRGIPSKLGVSWVDNDHRVHTLPYNPVLCQNDCSICKSCWTHKGDVILHKH